MKFRGLQCETVTIQASLSLALLNLRGCTCPGGPVPFQGALQACALGHTGTEHRISLCPCFEKGTYTLCYDTVFAFILKSFIKYIRS